MCRLMRLRLQMLDLVQSALHFNCQLIHTQQSQRITSQQLRETHYRLPEGHVGILI